MGHGRSEVSRRVGSLGVRERIIGKSNPYPTSSRRPPLTSSGLSRMVAVAAHSRFSSPAGMRLAGKFVSNSTNGMLAEERDRQTVTAPREQWEPVEVPEKEHGEGNGGGEGQEAAGAGRVSTAKFLIGQAESALLDWLSELLLFRCHLYRLQITEVPASVSLALSVGRGLCFPPSVSANRPQDKRFFRRRHTARQA